MRAGVPMAYSSGFNPHPRVSYAGAAPTGAASEAEYVEIGLREISDPKQVLVALDEALPSGLDVLEVVASGPGALADRLEASHWLITLPEVDVEEARSAVARFCAEDEILVERMTKRGMREFDCRAAVVRLDAGQSTDRPTSCAILDLVLRHGTPSVRPDDILVGLHRHGGIPGSTAALFQRLAQGPLDAEAGTVGDPLAPDRDTE